MKEVIDTLRSYDVDICVEQEFHDFLREKLRFDIRGIGIYCRKAEDMPRLDYAVSMGGDGTFLKTASVVSPSGVPILGINTGRLGFLADIKPTEIADAFCALNNNSYSIESRTLIEVDTGDARLEVPPYALNEVAVLKHDNSSTINICTRVNGQNLTTYIADGLILSTPSGSTGYSLSVGGPILTPDIDAFVIAPVAPHSLSIRPIVVSADSVVTMSVESRNHNYLVAIDGRNQSFNEKVGLTLRKAPFELKVVKLQGRSFYHALREKLLWGEDRRGR